MDMRSRVLRVINEERLAPELGQALRNLEKGAIIRRIWARDWTVWKDEDREITNRLGWLDAPRTAEEEVKDLEALAARARGRSLTRAVILGMGGSSLAPELFARVFGTASGCLEIEVLDTTEPETVTAAAARLNIEQTLFVVSSKSGTTAELVALLSFFYDRVRRGLGEGAAGSRFVAVTDPGTPLEALAGELGFERVFHGHQDIGGRFSALSAFGLLPAALKGIDLRRLLASAASASAACRLENPTDNPGAFLGAVLGAAAATGRDKLTLLVPRRLEPLAAWLEQLIAESTGKEGQGIVPVIECAPEDFRSCCEDRLGVDFPARSDEEPRAGAQALVDAGAPLARLTLDDPYSLAGQLFIWEFATSVAAHVLGINPFDQPDVESTKRKTREVLAGGACADALKTAGADGPGEELSRFLGRRRDGDYLAVLAFLPRRDAIEDLLSRLAGRLRFHARLPVTIGFGPRYLHSTGQLHKGDGNKGMFLMLVASDLGEARIPEVRGITRPAPDFAGLFRAQAQGDRLALMEKGRRVLTLELHAPIEAGLRELVSLLG